ncbi:hypothetical protein BURMUCF1_A2124 [Burkholderia multivorans ATCC BAA-247]|nr:hypothetical protein BURMUCF1_A2124 [Burkholderia multivorans ATCC BAA-247]
MERTRAVMRRGMAAHERAPARAIERSVSDTRSACPNRRG